MQFNGDLNGLETEFPHLMRINLSTVRILNMHSREELTCHLAGALTAAGYQVAPDDKRLTPLVEKLELLRKAGHYSRLLSNLCAANDLANLRSLMLEATFAFHFQSAGMPLQYEVRRRPDDETSVDFLHRTKWSKEFCIEMRLVQQRQAHTTLFEMQLRESNYFGTELDGAGDRAETLRLQRLVLEKAVNPRGQLVKFSPEGTSTYNIIAIEVSELHLGMIDYLDCQLVAYGDPAVPGYARRGLFGLFQESRKEDPDYFQEMAARFAPFRDGVHAILFLRHVPPGHLFDYRLEYLLASNKRLVTQVETTQILWEFRGAMDVWESVCLRDSQKANQP
jgi:hypothetical protein